MSIGRKVARQPWYWPGHEALGPTLPICFAPYDDDPTHYVGGLTFAPRPALVDMRDWSATNGTARPWLSVMSQAAPGGWKGVSGNARVVTSSPDDAKMCEAQQGQYSADVDLQVKCEVV